MMSWSACLLRSETDQLGPLESARPAASYTISWDIIYQVSIADLNDSLDLMGLTEIAA